MGIEGHLDIQLKIKSGAVSEVRIESTRPVHASRVFQGKAIAETLKTIPLLFNICGTAQACAGIRAFEQALGLHVSARMSRTREALVNMETLREHLWRILLDWPSFIDEAGDNSAVVEMAAIQRDYRQAVCSGGEVFQLGNNDCQADSGQLESVLARLDAVLQGKVFAMSPEQWLAISGLQAFDAWLRGCDSAAAKLIRHVVDQGWSSVGACESDALPELESGRLHQAMQEPAFVEQPQWNGHRCETSCLTRVDTLLMQSLKQQYGNGLLVRLVSRLSEIAQLSGRLVPDEDLSEDEAAASRPSSPAIGQVSAARGQLIHRVNVDGEKVTAYQILAPTEWNFHPRGVVARSLAALEGEAEAIEQQARLLINAIDPCVGYELHIVEN